MAKHSEDRKMNVQQMTRIMTGSCTPASDLMTAVDSGKITYQVAQDFYRGYRRGRTPATLRDDAVGEMAYMKSADI